MLNRIILIGRLATDPELKYTPSGVAVTNFRLAVDRPYTGASGEREADFLTIKVWRQQAETVANYLLKGRLVAVEGRLEVRTWTAQDGSKRSAAEVVADSVRFLDRAPQGEGAPARESGGYEGPRTAAPDSAGGPGPQPGPAPTGGPSFANSVPAAEEADFGDPFAEE